MDRTEGDVRPAQGADDASADGSISRISTGTRSGGIVTRVTTDVDVLNDLFSSGLVTIVGDVLMLYSSRRNVRMSPGMTGLMLAVMPIVILVTAQFRRTASQSYRKHPGRGGENQRLPAGAHRGNRRAAALQSRREKQRGIRNVNRDHMLAFKDSIIAYGWFYPVVEFLGMLGLGVLLAYGGFRIRQGALTLGVLVAFFQYGLRFFRPIQDLSEKYNILQSAMAASERIFKLLDTQPGIVAPAGTEPLPPRRS